MASLSSLLNPALAPDATPLSVLEPQRDGPETSRFAPATSDTVHHGKTSSALVSNEANGRATGQTTRREGNDLPTSPLGPRVAAASHGAIADSPTAIESTNAVDVEQYQSLPSLESSEHAGPVSGVPPAPANLDQSFPGLAKYHQPTSQEVRARTLSNTLSAGDIILPPLTLSNTENPSRYTMQIDEPIPMAETGMADTQDAMPPTVNLAPYMASEENANMSKHPESSETPQIHSPAHHSPSEASQSIAIKAEVSEAPLPPETASSSVEKPAFAEAQQRQNDAHDEPTSDHAVSATTEVKPDPNSTPTNTASSAMPAKRKAPAKKRPAAKKGTASIVKPPAKRRKLDTDTLASSPPASLPRGTPASSRASKTPAPRNPKQHSQTPTRSPSVLDPDGAYSEEDADESDEIFCICRKPDDHTWMIACDGPCNDWYHGRCVNMDERDGSLIDKYICEYRIPCIYIIILLTSGSKGPNCKDPGISETLYKPMCRLEGCRGPARVNSPKPSKYCSREHGVEFMRHKISKRPPDLSKNEPPNKKRRKSTHTEPVGKSLSIDTSDEPHNPAYLRGGVLNPSELKTLCSSVSNVAQFKALGNNVLPTPPGTSKALSNGMGLPENQIAQDIQYNETETAQIANLTKKHQELDEQINLWSEREKLLLVVRARAKAALEEMKKRGESLKEICGYDGCLAWSMPEFKIWASSDQGKATLDFALVKDFNKVPAKVLKEPISLPAGNVDGANLSNASRTEDAKAVAENGHDSGEDEPPASDNKPNGATGPSPDEEDDDPILKGICTKKRCNRHKDWFKYEMAGNHSEKDHLRDEIKRVEREKYEIGERAMLRGLEREDEEEGVEGMEGERAMDGVEGMVD